MQTEAEGDKVLDFRGVGSHLEKGEVKKS